jgi:hypothetical protein
MRLLRRIFVALVVIVGVLAVVVAMQPSEFRVARTATSAAPARLGIRSPSSRRAIGQR